MHVYAKVDLVVALVVEAVMVVEGLEEVVVAVVAVVVAVAVAVEVVVVIFTVRFSGIRYPTTGNPLPFRESATYHHRESATFGNPLPKMGKCYLKWENATQHVPSTRMAQKSNFLIFLSFW